MFTFMEMTIWLNYHTHPLSPIFWAQIDLNSSKTRPFQSLTQPKNILRRPNHLTKQLAENSQISSKIINNLTKINENQQKSSNIDQTHTISPTFLSITKRGHLLRLSRQFRLIFCGFLMIYCQVLFCRPKKSILCKIHGAKSFTKLTKIIANLDKND